IINAVTKSNMKIEEGKESVDMCLAIQEMREESRIEGREEVKKSFMVKYKKSEQETEELMKIYWK
ncbi:MAG: transposase, partial [Lachnospiraceae bacterium]